MGWQITSVDGEEFRIKLIPDKIETKQRRKFNVREIGENTDLSEKIKIDKTKDSGDLEIDIDLDHDLVYSALLVYWSMSDVHILLFLLVRCYKSYPDCLKQMT